MPDPQTQRERARRTFLVFIVVGLGVTLIVTLLTDTVTLGLLYGIAPGVILGALAWYRISRGGLLTRVSSKDRPGPF